MSVSAVSTTNRELPLMLPKAILFDMDGTLTQPVLDFDQIRTDIGIGPGPILESILKMSEADRVVAERILYRHENQAAKDSQLNPGCGEVLSWLDHARIPTALVTRNTRKSVQTVFRRHGLNFDICITREDGKYKPDPAPLHLACERLKVEPTTAWMIGDGNHDIEAGRAANIRTIWISHGQQRHFKAEPDHVVNDLIELLKFLKTTAPPIPLPGHPL